MVSRRLPKAQANQAQHLGLLLGCRSAQQGAMKHGEFMESDDFFLVDESFFLDEKHGFLVDV